MSTTTTAPYAADADERIRHSARHVLTATAYPNGGGAPIELDVESASLVFDDSTAPRIQGTLTCKAPSNATLDALDARKTFRVKVYAGYKYDSVTEDVQLLADLHARDRDVQRPQNRVVFTLHSDEGLAMDYRRLAWDSQPPQSNVLDAVQYHVNIATNGTGGLVVSDYPNDFGAAAVAGLVQDPGTSGWDMLHEIASRAGVAVYCQSDRTWRIAKPQAISSTVSLNLTGGGGGTLIESKAVTSRENFRNAVCIRYRWRSADNVDHVIYGHAYVGAGDYSLAAIGYNSYFEDRDYAVTQEQANQAAVTALQALSRRGRSFVLKGISAYWLRPGQTVTATLPDADGQERLLVSAVSFDFPSGAMQVRLRQPEDYELKTTA